MDGHFRLAHIRRTPMQRSLPSKAGWHDTQFPLSAAWSPIVTVVTAPKGETAPNDRQ